MPELPEVEFAARSLRRWLEGRVIARAEAEPSRVFRGSDPTRFEHELASRRVEGIERRGKYLLFAFSGDVGLLSHLGMTGKWVRTTYGEPGPRHERARLKLCTGEVIHYDDSRMFGRIAIYRASALLSLPEIRALGPDPLIDGVDPDELLRRFGKTSRAVKVALMDPALIAGLGNIQATEALFRARVHPARVSSSITAAEALAIAKATAASIAHTLEAAGDEEIRYLSEGHADNRFLVYARAGSPCPRCQTTLEQVSLGGRSSVYCPHCQRR